MSNHQRVFAIATSIAGLVAVLLAPSAIAAPDYVLDAKGIEQTVLRAQMPRTMGSWHQNIYFTMADEAPQICWSATGTPVSLPNTSTGGAVGYEISPRIGGSVSLFQYATAAEASAALAALRAFDCPDTAKVALDVGAANLVAAQQGSDFTSAAKTAVVSSVSYTDNGLPVITETRTSVTGLLVVQTEVTISGSAATTKNLDRMAALNTRWSKQAVAAAAAFGKGNSR